MLIWIGTGLIGLVGILATPLWIQALKRHDYNNTVKVLLVTVIGVTQVLFSPVSNLITFIWLVSVLGVVYLFLAIIVVLFLQDARRGRAR